MLIKIRKVETLYLLKTIEGFCLTGLSFCNTKLMMQTTVFNFKYLFVAVKDSQNYSNDILLKRYKNAMIVSLNLQ